MMRGLLAIALLMFAGCSDSGKKAIVKKKKGGF